MKTPIKILHVTHHQGCKQNIDFVCRKLSYEVETQMADWNYNMGQTLADSIWYTYKDYYNSFDVAIVSDTASLCRIFLREGFKGKLIVWICNRFDYSDEATNTVGFPDGDFYLQFAAAEKSPNVKIFPYTQFETEYAKKYRGIELKNPAIKPYITITSDKSTTFPDGKTKGDTFLIPQYHNDTILINLSAKCDELGIKNYCGRYDGASTLEGIKGIIHIPYAWSNFALFENWSLGNVYFIPSKEFLLKLRSSGGDFFWSPPFDESLLETSEWYLPEYKDLFVYFDNWEDLKWKASNEELINAKITNVYNFYSIEKTVEQWRATIENNK